MNKNIKSFEEWKEERAEQEAIHSGILTIMLLAIGLVAALASCSTRSITHTPSKREIRKAMRYSTSEYAMPQVPMPAHSKSPYADMHIHTSER